MWQFTSSEYFVSAVNVFVCIYVWWRIAFQFKTKTRHTFHENFSIAWNAAHMLFKPAISELDMWFHSFFHHPTKIIVLFFICFAYFLTPTFYFKRKMSLENYAKTDFMAYNFNTPNINAKVVKEFSVTMLWIHETFFFANKHNISCASFCHDNLLMFVIWYAHLFHFVFLLRKHLLLKPMILMRLTRCCIVNQAKRKVRHNSMTFDRRP